MAHRRARQSAHRLAAGTRRRRRLCRTGAAQPVRSTPLLTSSCGFMTCTLFPHENQVFDETNCRRALPCCSRSAGNSRFAV